MKPMQRITTTLTLIILFVSPFFSFGQSETNATEGSDTQWNMYGREVALDVHLLNRELQLSSIGTNFIFKKRLGEKKLSSLNDTKALRIQFAGYASYPLERDFDTLASLSNVNFYNWKSLSCRLLLGIEWQKQFNRIQLYYGLDAGIRFSNSLTASSINMGPSPGEVLSYRENTRSEFSIPIYAFMGVKYFIHPRISIALESALSTGISRSYLRRVDIDNLTNETITLIDAKRTEINFSTDYVRYINVAFHF